jgi:RNA polymerase sigma-70 factor (ECF subfamily)
MAQFQPPPTSSSLLEAVRNRDSDAWRRLVDIYGPTVYGWSRRAGLQSADAADVMQQVFVTVAAHIQQFHPDRTEGAFGGWLWTLFHSRLMDFFRDHQRQPRAVGDSEVKRLHDAMPEQFLLSDGLRRESDAAEQVQRALTVIQRDFAEASWQAFWRTAVEQQPTGQVALDLGMTPAAVCMARSRILRRLRETLAGLGVFDLA